MTTVTLPECPARAQEIAGKVSKKVVIFVMVVIFAIFVLVSAFTIMIST